MVWRGGRNATLLSEMERVRAMQLFGANPGVKAWLSERQIQEFCTTTTLTASERNGFVLFLD
jgi:hypothetical protein